MSRHYERDLSLTTLTTPPPPPPPPNACHSKSQENRKMKLLCEDLKPAIASVSI